MKTLVFREEEVTPQADICGRAIDLINEATTDCKTLSLATIFLDPGKSSQRHLHRVMEEIYYFVEGEGKLYLGDEIYGVSPGLAAYIPQNVPHHIENTGATVMKLISVDAPPFDPSDIVFTP